MGNSYSENFQVEHNEIDYWWHNTQYNNEENPRRSDRNEVEAESDERRKQRLREELNEFKLELARKHEKRRQLIQEKHKEMLELRQQVKQLSDENEQLKRSCSNYDEIESLKRENNELKMNLEKIMGDSSKLDELNERNRELKIVIANTQKELQDMNSEIMNFESERQDYKNHVRALKDVIAVSKQMLAIRENQLKELKQKVNEIEASIASKDLATLSLDLQKEYEKQLENMRNLKVFYEERLRAHIKEKDEMRRLLDATKQDLHEQKEKNQELQSNVDRLEEENSKKYDEIKNLESTLGLTKAECRQYQAELTVINQLFSQILLNFSSNQDIDIDRLIELLEENHHLLQDIAVNEVSNETASALPKVLLDLVREVTNANHNGNEDQDGDNNGEIEQVEQSSYQLNSATEIVENLPKVWKILIQLLSQQCAPVNVLKGEGSDDNPCYKLVETPKGSQLVLSVSRTFIRLKDLILEKKSLERETGRLKQLNQHLECRLTEQEKRLEMVSNELTETWHVVGQLQKKHQLLHTQEKILRYELAQKRKLLNQLKEELEDSREKWLEAREKNTTTEKQWEQLRNEFASRKTVQNDDLNNSQESGYSDGRECTSSSNEDDEEPGYETDISECNQRESDETTNDAPQPIVDVIQNEILTIVAEAETEIISDDNNNDNNNNSNADNDDEASSSSNGGVSSSSSDNINGNGGVDLDKILSAREERLKRLEGQCSSLVKQVVNTTDRSAAISNRLDVLHEIYGESSRDNTNRSGEDRDGVEDGGGGENGGRDGDENVPGEH